jgi:predicted esterase
VVLTRVCLLLGACSGIGCAPAGPGASSAEAGEPFVELAVPGHSPAVVSLPGSGRSARPLLVAAHGAGDRAEWHCELWRGIVGERAFILCPRGQRTDARVPPEQASYYYPDHFALEKEVLAAIVALRARYPEELDATAAVWAGFSQGAIHGAFLITLHPKLFPRAALVEGGNGFFDEWSPWAARRYKKGGGQRILFACGSPWCVRTADRCAGYLDKAGCATRVVHAEGAGHSYGPEMQAELAESFAWLVEGDTRWSLE